MLETSEYKDLLSRRTAEPSRARAAHALVVDVAQLRQLRVLHPQEGKQLAAAAQGAHLQQVPAPSGPTLRSLSRIAWRLPTAERVVHTSTGVLHNVGVWRGTAAQ